MSTANSRQRPKVANYSERHVEKESLNKPNLAIPKKVVKSGSVDSKRVRVASSGKPNSSGPTNSVSESGGKMTKFKNLDDIPDISEDYAPCFDDDDYEDEYNDEEDEYEAHHQDDQGYNRPQVVSKTSHNPPPLPAEKLRLPHQFMPGDGNHHQYHDDQQRVHDHYDEPGRHGYEDEDDFEFDDISDDDDSDADDTAPVAQNRHAAPKAAIGGKAKGIGVHGHISSHHQAIRRPSPIVYDEDAGRKSRQQGGGPPQGPPKRVYSEEEKLYFDKQPREVAYKPYTIKEYRRIKPQSYVELGKLQPDLNTEELVAKRANAERIKEFSKNLKQFNKQAMPKRDVDDQCQQQAEPSKRDRARQFAQNIPKPKVRVETSRDFNRDDKGVGTNVGMVAAPVEASRLDELTSKHLQSRKQVDAIKKSLGL